MGITAALDHLGPHRTNDLATGTPPCIILTGMHRSGTSLLGRFMLASGIDMGEELLGPERSNPYGHFEDVEILAFHRRLLARCNDGQNLWVSNKPALTDDDRTEAEQFIARRRMTGGTWGWKEPRTCLFLDTWADLIPEARFLFVYRDPLMVMESLARRHKIGWTEYARNNRCLQTWLLFNRELLAFCRRQRGRCVLVSLQHAIERPGTFVRLLSERLGHPFAERVFRGVFDESALTRARPPYRLTSVPLRHQCAQMLHTLDLYADL